MTRIPKTLHYIFGMAHDFGGKPWSLIHHVCLKSAVERIQPDRVCFYYEFEPTGPWWDLSKPMVELVKIKAPKEIFGRPLCHVAHQADVVRLQVLIEHGGIYLDADVLVQKNFDDLLDYPAVLGQEGEGASWGTANAVILAEPGSAFLKRWLNEYRSFRSKGRDEYWSEHSVTLPSKMAPLHPEEVLILSHKAFFWPLWTDEHLHLCEPSMGSSRLEIFGRPNSWPGALSPKQLPQLDNAYAIGCARSLWHPSDHDPPSEKRKARTKWRARSQTSNCRSSETRISTGCKVAYEPEPRAAGYFF
jgi:hypothetical protein